MKIHLMLAVVAGFAFLPLSMGCGAGTVEGPEEQELSESDDPQSVGSVEQGLTNCVYIQYCSFRSDGAERAIICRKRSGASCSRSALYDECTRDARSVCGRTQPLLLY
jgi:hypothetical protein